MAVCPKCGGDNFQYDLRMVGMTSASTYYRTNNRKSWIIPASYRVHQNRLDRHAVGFCKDCGYIDEIMPEKPRISAASIIGMLAAVIGLFCVFVGTWMIEATKNSAIIHTAPKMVFTVGCGLLAIALFCVVWLVVRNKKYKIDRKADWALMLILIVISMLRIYYGFF